MWGRRFGVMLIFRIIPGIRNLMDLMGEAHIQNPRTLFNIIQIMVEICILKLDPEDAIFVVEYLDYAKFLAVGKFCSD